MAKRKHRRCDICGETDLHTRKVTLTVDGLNTARWRMCLACGGSLLITLAQPPWSKR